MKNLKLLSFLIIICLIEACKKDFPVDPSQVSDDGYNSMYCNPLNLKIAVISDIHYAAPSLFYNDILLNWSDGLESYLDEHQLLIYYSDPIFKEVISQLKRDKPNIVLIPGDLTKDGEKMSHEAVALILHQLIEIGIKVFVIPGDVDINNPEAVIYERNGIIPTPTIQSYDFPKIYADFGYKNALFRDSNSLSYISQPYKGLWILAIDDCEYYDNTENALIPGKIKTETLTWILRKLREAKQKNITVLSMMHHGILEHYTGQEQFDPGYVTNNWEMNADLLMEAGLKVMFTGHYHANDITMRRTNNRILYDIETGSLVTPPCPYRIVTLTNKAMDITTNHITSINYPIPNGLSFTDFSNDFLMDALNRYFFLLMFNKYGVSEEHPDYWASFAGFQFDIAMMAHFAGDESITPTEKYYSDLIGTCISPMLGSVIYNIWTDLPPADNQLHIDLK